MTRRELDFLALAEDESVLPVMEVEAQWTGAYPCLCFGTWKLFVNGNDVSYVIPADKADVPMDTLGTYPFVGFDGEVTAYTSGMDCAEWCKENQKWLSEITTETEEQAMIFRAFQLQDWRRHSCGGCM